MSERMLWLIGTGIITAIGGIVIAMSTWAIQGVHDTQVEQGQKLAVVATKIDVMTSSVAQMNNAVDQMRSQQINDGDLRRLEASIEHQLSEQTERMKSIEQRVRALETRR